MKPAIFKDDDRTWRKIARENFPRNAMHESGHAFACFLFNVDIEHVCMKVGPGNQAHVRTSGIDRMMVLGRIEGGSPAIVRWIAEFRKPRGLQMMFDSLLGPAVQNKLEDVPEGDWLEYLQYDSDGETDDFGMAMTVAKVLSDGNDRKAWKLLYRVADWCDELIESPRVWVTISALAEKLRYGRTMDGWKAISIMRKAWGGDRDPLRELGRTWHRRFSLPSMQSLIHPAST